MSNNHQLKSQKLLAIMTSLKTSQNIATTYQLLKVVKDIISSQPDEVECFYQINGFLTILRYLTEDSVVGDICIRILIYAASCNAKIKKTLLKINIFNRLMLHFNQDISSLSQNRLVEVSALTMILADRNSEAQTQIRKCGFLTRLASILSSTLKNPAGKQDCEKIECLTYAMSSCICDPINVRNQNVIGWIVPMIINYLFKDWDKSIRDDPSVKYFWSFLRDLLDKNKANQQLFLENFGFNFVFMNLEKLTNQDNVQESGDMLRRITGVLVTLCLQEVVTKRASEEKFFKLLCRLLNEKNYFVLRNTITFLGNLVKAHPEMLNFLNETDVQPMKSALLVLTNKIEPRDIKEKIQISKEDIVKSQATLLGILNKVQGSAGQRHKLQQSPKPQTQSKEEKLHRTSTNFHRIQLLKKERQLRRRLKNLLKTQETRKGSPLSFIRSIVSTPAAVVRKCWSYISGSENRNRV